MTQTPPGWYDQQSATTPLRWFDGTEWTDYGRLDHVPYERRHVFMKHEAGPGWLRLSTALTWLLAGCGLLVIASLAYYVWLAGQVSDWQVQPPTEDLADRVLTIEDGLGTARMVGLPATGLVFILWLFIAHRSDRVAADRRRHRSFWALLAWFVPIVNLFLPPSVVSDVRRASQREDNPPARRMLGAWWGCGLASVVIAGASPNVTPADLDDFYSVVRWAIVGDLFLLAAFVMVILLVREIRERVRTSPYGPQRSPLAQVAAGAAASESSTSPVNAPRHALTPSQIRPTAPSS